MRIEIKVMSKDKCLAIAKIVDFGLDLSEDELLLHLPDSVFGRYWEVKAIDAGCLIIHERKDREWSIPFYFVETTSIIRRLEL